MSAVRVSRVGIVCQFLLASSLQAQRVGPTHSVRWWEAAAVVGAVGAAAFADHGLDRWIQDHRSARGDAWARGFRNGGQPQIVFGVAGGILAAGLVSGRPSLRRAGARVLASVAVAGLTTAAIKEVAGRVRPTDTDDPLLFRPFSSHDAFPSGHATLAFALATSLGEEIHKPWVAAVLYTGAAGTAWSRLNDHRHWLSDVLAGASVGITAAKIVEGRWRIFGLRPPRFLARPGGGGLEWRVAF